MYHRFIPICPKCGREGHFPKDCPWKLAIIGLAVPYGSVVLTIKFLVWYV